MRTVAIIVILSVVMLSAAIRAEDLTSQEARTNRARASSIKGTFLRGSKTDVPALINYQGTLTDGGSVAVDTAISMIFTIYTDSTGGTAVWTETQPSVMVSDGVFNVLLGSVNSIVDTVFKDPQRWLGIQVGIDPEMQPRQRIASVPYAIQAASGGSDGDWTILGDAIYSSVSGNVGIGTAAPLAKLDVRDTSSTNTAGYFQISNSSNDTIALYAETNGGGHAIYGKGSLDWGSHGVFGISGGNYGYLGSKLYGVYGINQVSDIYGHIAGEEYGVYGYHDSTDTYGYLASKDHGVYGFHEGPVVDSWNYGYLGSQEYAIYGYHHSVGNYGYIASNNCGVYGQHSGAGSYGGLGWGGTGAKGFSSVGYGVHGSSTVGTGVYGTSASGLAAEFEGDVQITDRLGIGTASPTRELDVIGSSLIGDTLFVGTGTQDGFFRLYRNGSVDPVATVQDLSNDGGSIRLFDSSGNLHTSLDPDYSTGGGGWLEVYRNESSVGFEVNGNWSNTQEPMVRIMGSTASVSFDMSTSTPDARVNLPNEAIFADEIGDEPGAASITGDGMYLTGAIDILLQRSIICPAAGYVLVIGSCEATVIHTDTTTSNADFGVSDSSDTFPVNQDIELRLPEQIPTASYDFPVTVHGLFEVDSGTHTFYFLAWEKSGNLHTLDTQLTLIFLPTAYGLVSPTLVRGGNVPDEQAQQDRPVTPADIRAERAETEAFHMARLERELTQMRADLERLKQEVRGQEKNEF